MSCWNILGHKFYIPSVSWLRKERIPFSVVIQRQGEGIVVLPNAAHSGGNLSFNWSEACNFATKSWLPYGAVSPPCSCIPGSVHPIDLRPATGVHARHLLGAYLRNDISSAAEDGYFHKSVISYQNIKGLAQSSKGSEDKLTCPLCAYSWCKPLKLRNVKNHVKRHHPKFTQDSRVVQFFKGNFNK
ncbi:uncharacterized protein LOC127750438 [Frankliniella occidentalis]|uniref:Uncharacterized protein LOC127750438 n=1 Tax=Frankliniella occidentalis TaxID=133901 RepID=A0A9C6XR78_FRAOC|nr:uncharacterized protein LOC127750438 [Frankliniella occidentalis]